MSLVIQKCWLVWKVFNYWLLRTWNKVNTDVTSDNKVNTDVTIVIQKSWLVWKVFNYWLLHTWNKVNTDVTIVIQKSWLVWKVFNYWLLTLNFQFKIIKTFLRLQVETTFMCTVAIRYGCSQSKSALREAICRCNG